MSGQEQVQEQKYSAIDGFLYDDDGNVTEEIIADDESAESEQEDDSVFFDEEGEEEAGDESDSQEESEESEGAEETKKALESDKVEAEVNENKDQAPKAVANKDSEFSQAVLTHIKPEYIPGSKEFFEAVELAAIENFKKETGEEFDEFNHKHILRLDYYARRDAAAREVEFKAAVDSLKERKTAQDTEKQLSEKLDNVLSTPELKKKFGEELRKISVAKYAEFEAEIAKGNFDGLIDFASKVVGFSKSVAGTAAKDKKKVSKPSGVKLFSDFLV